MNMLGFSDPELIHLVVAIECFEKSQDSSSVTAFGFYGREDRPEALQEIDLGLFKERKTKGDEARVGPRGATENCRSGIFGFFNSLSNFCSTIHSDKMT